MYVLADVKVTVLVLIIIRYVVFAKENLRQEQRIGKVLAKRECVANVIRIINMRWGNKEIRQDKHDPLK